MIHNIHRKDHIFGSYMCLFIDFSGFYILFHHRRTRYTSINQLHKLHLMHLLQTTYDMNSRCLRSLLATHQRRIAICIYIILSICERYFRSLTFLLRNRVHPPREENIVQSDAPYELCHHVPLAYWPSSSCSIYTNIYPCGCG
jgi:hypothetical protein